MGKNKNYIIRTTKLPVVDYDDLVNKIKDKVNAMTYWPTNSIVEFITRLTISELTTDFPDTKSPIAMGVRMACHQYLDDRNKENDGTSEQELVDKLRNLQLKYFDIKYGQVSGKRVRKHREHNSR